MRHSAVLMLTVAQLLGAASLPSACGGGTASAPSAPSQPSETTTSELQGASIADPLAAGNAKSVHVEGYLFGFGAYGGPSTILLCSAAGDPCALPKLGVVGLDYAAAKRLMMEQNALDGPLVNGDGFRETKPFVLTGALHGNTLTVS